MDEQTYASWWPLHLRAVRGETLNVEERARYEAGLSTLNRQEQLDGGLADLRRARQALTAATATREALQARRDALAAEIRTLEAAVDERTRQALGMTS